jgi:hypothetical protein
MKKIDFTPEYLSTLPLTVEEAIRNGSKYYYDAFICSEGHKSPKIVKGGRCFLCKRESTRRTAEKRRRRLGVKVQEKIAPLLPGERFGQLTATGRFKSKITENRIKNRKVNFYEVICDCGKIFWINLYRWKESEQCTNCAIKKMSFNNITHGLSKLLEGRLHYTAKKRAKESGLTFNLDVEDIVIPDKCPILGFPLDCRIGINPDRKPRFNAPSVDRLNSSLGYTKGNVVIMSYKANVLKKDGTSEEHFKVAEFMEKMGVKK